METHQVLVHYAVARCKESQNVRYKVSLLRLQRVPVLNVLGKIDLERRSCTRDLARGASRGMLLNVLSLLTPLDPELPPGTPVASETQQEQGEGPGTFPASPKHYCRGLAQELGGKASTSSEVSRFLILVTSSAVQKEASAFLYICQISWYSIGKMTKRRGFSRRSGSSSTLGASTLVFCRPRE